MAMAMQVATPTVLVMAPGINPGIYQSGLFDCCQNLPGGTSICDNGCLMCLRAHCCAPSIFCANTEHTYGPDQSSSRWCYNCCYCIGFYYGNMCCVGCLGASVRDQIRMKYNIMQDQSWCGDRCKYICCHPCALLQDRRELAYRKMFMSGAGVAAVNMIVYAAPVVQTM